MFIMRSKKFSNVKQVRDSNTFSISAVDVATFPLLCDITFSQHSGTIGLTFHILLLYVGLLEGYERLAQAKENGTANIVSCDMFGDDENAPEPSSDLQPSSSISGTQLNSDYVFDESSGYVCIYSPLALSCCISQLFVRSIVLLAIFIMNLNFIYLKVFYKWFCRYYYSSSLGYYYDPNTGLYCYATTGKW